MLPVPSTRAAAHLEPMTTAGIHHVTAICGDPRRNVDFYSSILGLRLVKRTVDFDDPQTYHLYYGDEIGSPGSLITFFPWPDAPRGAIGPGQIAVTSFAVPPNALGFWIERLLRNSVRYRGPTARRLGSAGEQVLSFADGDGLLLEIVATPVASQRSGWDGAPGIPAQSAIRGIHGVTLWEEDGTETAALLVDVLGFERIGEEETTQHFAAGAPGARSTVNVRTVGGFPKGNVSVGAVHHVAFRVSSDDAQLEMRRRLLLAGFDPTPVIDRTYFQSVYFREPGGVLFEIATDGPGFEIDEPKALLGEQLMLPPHYERYRQDIVASLPEIRA